MTTTALWLRARLDDRRQRHPAYSLRAYAKALGLSPATLSALMNGKRTLSVAAALRIAEREDLGPEERQQLLKGVAPNRAALLAAGAAFGAGARAGNRRTGAAEYAELDLDRYRLIADWYHFAILSLGELPGSRLEPRWIAGRLGITTREADDAVRRLRRLGILKRVGTGFRQATGPLTTPAGVASAAIRKSHRQLLGKAEKALDEVPVERRDMGAIIMAADTSRLPAAVELMRRFRRELNQLLEGGRPDAVYACTVQLFPLTKE